VKVKVREKAAQINLAGIQLAIFEILWDTFRWVDRIYMKSEAGCCVICIQSASKPADEEWDACCGLMNEILNMALDGQATLQEIVGQRDAPGSAELVEIMSPSIFREIAKEVDPSRLDIGR
jgi:hypothetical protein